MFKIDVITYACPYTGAGLANLWQWKRPLLESNDTAEVKYVCDYVVSRNVW